jgi:hypothetical protein
MRYSRPALAAAVLIGATAVGFGLTAGTAVADSDERLPIASFHDIAVDALHQRVFISDPITGKIVATDYQGHDLVEVTGLTSEAGRRENGVQGLALSADSSLLYAVVPGAHAIVALSTVDLTEQDRYEVGAGIWPEDVVPVDGRLWFSFDTASYDNGGNLGSIDLATDAVQLHDQSADGITFNGPPALSWGASAPGFLLAADVRTTGSDVGVFNVSTGTAQLQFTNSELGVILHDVALAGDGSSLYRLGYGGVNRVGVPDGVITPLLTGNDSFTALDVAQDGRVAVSVDQTSVATDIFVLSAGSGQPEQSLTLPKPAGTTGSTTADVTRRGLAWEPGGPRLFAIAESGSKMYLYTLNDPDPVEPDPTTASPSPSVTPSPSPSVSVSSGPVLVEPYLDLSGPLESPWGSPVTISGQFSDSRSLRHSLTVTRVAGDTPVPAVLKTVQTDEAGFFSFVDSPPYGGENLYTVSFAGDGHTAARTVQRVVVVTRVAPSLVLTRDSQAGGPYSYGATATVTATLGKTYQNRVVEIWADPDGSEPNRLLKRATVNSAGKITASVRLTRNTMVTARFNADLWSNATYYRMNLWTRVSASTKLSRHYRTGKIGSTTYQYFRKSKDPLIAQTMTPYPGRKVRTIFQVWSGGKWTLWSGRYTKLSSAGKASFTFATGAKVGKRFRVRAEYLRGSSGDTVNYTSAGAWKYFTYTR